jgi:cysteine desulfuration protein SufE
MLDFQEKFAELFELDDSMDKYEYIIELGKELPKIDTNKKIDLNLIEGCQSNVWLDAQFSEGKMMFFADSDAIITKGIIGLLIRVLNDEYPEDIVKADLFFINQIGLHEHLSLTRSNGLASMVQKMKFVSLSIIGNKAL